VPFCVSCNADLLIDEARFCPLCGAPQPARAVAEAPDDEWAVAPVGAGSGAWDDGGYRVAGAEGLGGDFSRDGSTDGARVEPGAEEQLHAAKPPVVRFDAIARASKRLASSYTARLWRLAIGDLVVGGGCAALIAGLFLPWFRQVHQALVALPGAPRTRTGHLVLHVITVRTTIDATGAGAWHWLIAVLAALVLVYIGLRILPGRTVLLPLPHWQLLAVACSILLGLTLMSLALPPDLGKWSIQGGAYLGIGGAVVAAAGVVLRRSEAEVITQPAGNWFVARRIAYLQEKRQRAAEAEALAAAAAAEKAAEEEAAAQATAAAELATRQIGTRRAPEQLSGSPMAAGQWDPTQHVIPSTVRVHPPSSTEDEGAGYEMPAPGPPSPPEQETTIVRVVGAGGGTSAPPFVPPRPGEEVHVRRFSGPRADTPGHSAPLTGAVASVRGAGPGAGLVGPRTGPTSSAGVKGGGVTSVGGAASPGETSRSGGSPASGGTSGSGGATSSVPHATAAPDTSGADADTGGHEPVPDKPRALECAVCGTVNLPSARACRTCGVMLAHKPPRR
jgi:hypothetical protein